MYLINVVEAVVDCYVLGSFAIIIARSKEQLSSWLHSRLFLHVILWGSPWVSAVCSLWSQRPDKNVNKWLICDGSVMPSSLLWYVKLTCSQIQMLSVSTPWSYTVLRVKAYMEHILWVHLMYKNDWHFTGVSKVIEHVCFWLSGWKCGIVSWFNIWCGTPVMWKVASCVTDYKHWSVNLK